MYRNILQLKIKDKQLTTNKENAVFNVIVSNRNNDIEQHKRNDANALYYEKHMVYMTCDKHYNTYKMPLTSSSSKVPLKNKTAII